MNLKIQPRSTGEVPDDWLEWANWKSRCPQTAVNVGSNPTSSTMRKSLTPREFREGGYLQEVNRLFFHPLGLALALNVERDDEGNLRYEEDPEGWFRVQVWDERDDPEGWFFAEGELNHEHVRKIRAEVSAKSEVRRRVAGAVIQPPGAHLN